MSQLSEVLLEHFIKPLQNLPYSVVCIIDCLNAATMYPQFFHRVDNDPNTFYIFVTRGKFSEARRGKFKTTCPGVKTVAFPNVMVLSCCSSYMYTRRLNTSSRCSLECKVPEGLFNVWSKSSGSGGPRFPEFLTRLNEMAIDACQLDDFIIGITSAILTYAGRSWPEIFSADGRFYAERIELPHIVYPFFMVMHTISSHIAIPIYQKDSEILYRVFNNAPNPDYVPPQRIEGVPMHLSFWDTKTKLQKRLFQFKQARAWNPPINNVQTIDESQPGLEDVSSSDGSSYDDPVSQQEFDDLQREGFDKVQSDCNYIKDAPKIGTPSVEQGRRLFRDIIQ